MDCSRERLLTAPMGDFLSADGMTALSEAASSPEKDDGELVLVTALRRCSGGEIPVEITFRLVTFNDVLYGVAVARNITERRRAEQELKQSEERLRFASSAAGMGTWNWDLRTNELVWNERSKELFGFPPDFSVSYASFLDRVAEGDRPIVEESVQRALRNHSEYLAEMRVMLPDGSLRWVMSKGRGFYDEHGNPLGMHGIALDMTDRKKYEKELVEARTAAEAASRAKSQFLANMSHELRTPINGVMGSLQLLLGGYKGNLAPEQKDLLGKADRSVRALLGIIEDILDLSRIEAGKLILRQETFFLRETVSDAVELFAMEAHGKGLDFRLTTDRELPDQLKGDPVRIRQVLMNLVGNALKFTEEGSVDIAVTAESPKPDGRIGVRFSVTDTGIGIPKEKIPSLFQPFTQVDPSDTRRFGGTGLGLAICSRLVEMMGGTISLESEEGVGSCFWFTIPLQEHALEKETITELQVPRSPRQGPKAAILVAEDDPVASELLRNILEYHDLTADVARTGEEAVEKWGKNHYQLIIMDLQMPKMDGLTATRLIREKETTRGGHIPIMAMTAHAFPEDEKRCFAAGMDAFETKPLDFERGIQKVISLLRGHASTSNHSRG
jgi:PAS domain S-box-containing protein